MQRGAWVGGVQEEALPNPRLNSDPPNSHHGFPGSDLPSVAEVARAGARKPEVLTGLKIVGGIETIF